MWKTKVFKTRERFNAFVAANKGRYMMEEVFVNNAYGIDYKPIKKIKV